MNRIVYSRITGTGGYLPGAPVSNAELIRKHQLESSDDWITERTGIRTRHLVAANENASDLALEACRRALTAAGKVPADVDLIIVATSTPDFIFPSTAAILQRKLGVANSSPAFDLQAVCTGFVYAAAVADKFIRSGTTRCALVVGAEVFSRILDWKDRGTCVLFGDGAGAIVLEASDIPGILSTALHADGSYSEILNVPGQINGGQAIGDPFLRMDGQAVFKFAVRALAEVGEEVLAAAGMTIDQVDWLIPHQANIRIINATAKKLGLPAEKGIVTVAHHGNTSAASIPIALDEGVRDGRIKHGETLLLEGVGGGFTWGAALLKY
ncbi:3-oxoacyl-[acyl-carrier-protein] synthase III [Georgfuchsia toluolica]|uniref:Beta-ketoacyl-[acyl-carrier-protein] synthase III n=1 Tax=Georgfuchsia toluolica TaxID=424218 RepID=A0A916J3K2_9PROT|nr:3-oxoacyl-[acyl-carrier-protein] synthase III [Georgfuchsia toluolica]